MLGRDKHNSKKRSVKGFEEASLLDRDKVLQYLRREIVVDTTALLIGSMPAGAKAFPPTCSPSLKDKAQAAFPSKVAKVVRGIEHYRQMLASQDGKDILAPEIQKLYTLARNLQDYCGELAVTSDLDEIDRLNNIINEQKIKLFHERIGHNVIRNLVEQGIAGFGEEDTTMLLRHLDSF